MSALDEIFSAERLSTNVIEKNEVQVSRLTLGNNLQNKYDNLSSSRRTNSGKKGGQDSNNPDNNTRSLVNDLCTDSRAPSDNNYNPVPVQAFNTFIVSRRAESTEKMPNEEDELRSNSYDTPDAQLLHTSYPLKSQAEVMKYPVVRHSAVNMIDRNKDLVCYGKSAKNSKPTVTILTSKPRKDNDSPFKSIGPAVQLRGGSHGPNKAQKKIGGASISTR